jgi:hypothetical protein
VGLKRLPHILLDLVVEHLHSS